MTEPPVLEVGVKYCGGCNPRYDRVALFRCLEAQCPFARFVPAAPGRVYDAVLVLCGCTARCADQEGLEERYGRLVLDSGDGGPQALDLLRAALDAKKP